ncbi:hypothetical protein GGF32_001548 [Allomyces javanicus]|nr:hypothetical protein GGF32_001548 [Allomyces javanicus]
MAPAPKSSSTRTSPPRAARPLPLLALVAAVLLALTVTLPRGAHASTSALPSTNMMDRILIAVRNHLNTPVGPAVQPAVGAPAVVRATQTVTHTRTYTHTVIATPRATPTYVSDDDDEAVAGSAAPSPAPASAYAPPFDVASLLDARVQFAARAAPASESANSDDEVVLKSEDAISLTEWPLHVAAAVMHTPRSNAVVPTTMRRNWDADRVPARDRSAEVALELVAMVAEGAEAVLVDAGRYALLESRAW